jgi:hypothetical protein
MKPTTTPNGGLFSTLVIAYWTTGEIYSYVHGTGSCNVGLQWVFSEIILVVAEEV